MEQVASRYFGKGFDLCKKQVGRFHPELDIQGKEIDDELAQEEEEGEEEKNEEEGDQDTNPFSP